MARSRFSFIGRDKEVAALEGRYASSDSELLVVYGRRRVGKTELLTHVTQGKPTIFFTANAKLPVAQIRGFMRAAARWLRVPALAEAAPADWEAAFGLVLGAAPKDRKLLLIFDEFQWACRSSPELPSVIQQLWDHKWQNSGSLMLVLCGSFIGFMEREVLGGRSPLYGRRTGSFKLEPFSFLDAARFHPRWSAEEHARAYFICGGIPAYLRRLKSDMSVAQNIAREFFSRDAFFQNEPEFRLREELADVAQAMSILESVALGRKAQGQIAQAVGLSTAALAPHLKNFVQLGYLERVVPLCPQSAPRTSVAYRIADPLLRFWFRFVEPNISYLADLSPTQAFEQLVAPQWESFCGEEFDRLCREALPLLYKREGVVGRYKVGDYWDRDTQIDVVGLRSDGWIDLAECRWPADTSAAEAARDITARAARYPADGHTVTRRLFLRSEQRTAREGIRVHSLQELYGLSTRVLNQ
jgi:uncharacterized protein